MARGSFKPTDMAASGTRGGGQMRVSERHGRESTSEAWRLRALRSTVALFVAVLVSVTFAGAASADVSITSPRPTAGA
jgi:hypothetical protein